MLQDLAFDFLIGESSPRDGFFTGDVEPDVFVEVELVEEEGFLDIEGNFIVEVGVPDCSSLPNFSSAGKDNYAFFLVLPID